MKRFSVKPDVFRILVVIPLSFFLVITAVRAQDDPRFDPPVPQQFTQPPGTTQVNVITAEDGFDNFDLSPTNSAEPHMSTHPRNPLWFFNAFNINSTYRTLNGLTWTYAVPSFGVSVAGDPVTAYDSLGNLYYESMYGSPIAGCKVIRSTDNGTTWSAAVTSIAGVDKNWLAADQTSGPYANYVYTTMTRSGGGNFARSTDFGATWTNTFAPTTQSLPGMSVAVGPNVLGGNNISGGCVFVVTHSGTNAAGIYTFYTSTDGGLTFTQKSTNQFSNVIGTEISGRSTVQGMRCRPYPFIIADNSFGAYRGRLYLVYASNFPAGSGNKSDIFLRYSTDQGTTWSNAVTVNDDPNTQNNFQFHPAIWCDKETGRLHIKWYDTRRVPTSDSTDVYATYTDDGGQTFAPNQRLTNRTFKIWLGATPPAYQGDYDAITSNRYTAMAVWTDFRNRNYTGMTAYFPDFALLAKANRDTLRWTDSTFAVIKVPGVKLYTGNVRFTASVSPAANFVLTFPQGDSLTHYPDSLRLNIKSVNVAEGDYTLTVTGAGPNGTPVHQRAIALRIRYIPNAVTVRQPNGGEFWIGGQSRNITWSKTGDVDTVNLEYTANNGTSWLNVANGVPASLGSYLWAVPHTPSRLARVRVSWIDSLGVRDASDTTFTIAPPTPLIAVRPDSFSATLLFGSSEKRDTLRVANNGTVTLRWRTSRPVWFAIADSGQVAAGDSQRVPVAIQSAGLQPGTYRDSLVIASNDTFHTPIKIGLRLTVVGVPQIRLATNSVDFNQVTLGDTGRASLLVRNVGNDTLRGTTQIAGSQRFATSVPAFRIAPNDSSTLTLLFAPESTIVYRADVRLISNDPDPARDTLIVSLQGQGTLPVSAWREQTSGVTASLNSVKAVDGATAWIGGSGAVVLRTINGGNTWTNVGTATIAGDVYAVDALDAGTAFVATSPSGQPASIYRTTNGGASWTQVFSQTGGFIDGIAMVDPAIGYAVGDPVGGKWTVLKTTDGGATWARLTTEPTPASGSEAGWNNAFQVFQAGPRTHLWFGTNNSRVYHSADGGATWSSGPTPFTNSYGLRFNSTFEGIAVGENAARTTDGGATWIAVTIPGGGTITGASGSSLLDYWTSRGNSLYRSTDRGATWASSYTGTGSYLDLDFATAIPVTKGWAVTSTGGISVFSGTITAVRDLAQRLPEAFVLGQNYPNPFNPSTTINYQLPTQSHVMLKLYDVLGREVATIVNGVEEPGYKSVQWNGSTAASGVYFYRLHIRETEGGQAGSYVLTRKMLMLK